MVTRVSIDTDNYGTIFNYEKYCWLVKSKDKIVGFCPARIKNNQRLYELSEIKYRNFQYIGFQEYYHEKYFFDVISSDLKNKIDE